MREEEAGEGIGRQKGGDERDRVGRGREWRVQGDMTTGREDDGRDSRSRRRSA